MRCRVRFIVALALLGVLCTPNTLTWAKPGTPPGARGGYKITCRGSYEGRGNAAVGARSIVINLHLTHVDSGATGHLIASSLDLEDGGFSGTGRFAGQQVTVEGRVDAADGEILKKARICGTITMPDGLHVRFAGSRNGNAS